MAPGDQADCHHVRQLERLGIAQSPHQWSGAVRGVWFTYDDIVAIGQMLPKLMTGTQANSRAVDLGSAEGVDVEIRTAAAASLTDQDLRSFEALSSPRGTRSAAGGPCVQGSVPAQTAVRRAALAVSPCSRVGYRAIDRLD